MPSPSGERTINALCRRARDTSTPLSLGEIRGFKTRFHLYTVPGQVFYDASRKLILKGVDGVVFVADSQMERMEANFESIDNLRVNLAEQGYNLDKIPYVLHLSSVGAELESGNGPVAGLHVIEELLKGVDADVTNLRPSYFMENTMGTRRIMPSRSGITVKAPLPAAFFSNPGKQATAPGKAGRNRPGSSPA